MAYTGANSGDIVKRQKEWIEKHMGQLVESTYLNPLLLAILMSAGVIDSGDKSVVEESNNLQGKALKLYELAVTKVGFFDKLIEALRETNQSEAANILKRFYNT